MNQGTYPLAAAMINQLNRVDTIANNLANTNTNGFKQEGLSEGTFNHYLERSAKEGFNPTAINTVTNNIPKLDDKYISSEKGAMVLTGNELDFALKTKDSFFKVQVENGDIQYTRDGAFKSLNGMLVDSRGNNILGSDNEPIAIEDNFAELIGVVKIDYENLEKVGSNNYKVKDIFGIEFIEGNQDHVVQGSVEKSNVNGVATMVALIDAHRRFEQAQKAVTSIDTVNRSAIEKVGSAR